MQQLVLPLTLDVSPSFDSFVPGANAMPLQQLQALVAQSIESPGATVVYLWGPSGSGKTHLLRSLAAAFEPAEVAWFTAQHRTPWARNEHTALAVLDDCESLDAAQQHAAFALFVDAATRALPVVAAGRLPPVDLPLREDLRTRLGWGHVLALQPLSEADTRRALRANAKRRALELSDDVVDHLLTRFARDMKHLMALLERLDEYSKVHKRAITVPLLRQMLVDSLADSPVPSDLPAPDLREAADAELP